MSHRFSEICILYYALVSRRSTQCVGCDVQLRRDSGILVQGSLRFTEFWDFVPHSILDFILY